VSNGHAGPLDTLLGRAIHIHDEMRYADASSYWAMYQAWDTLAPRGKCGEDCPVYFDRVRDTVSISGVGYAIGHYARWIRRGAVRVDSETDDPLVLASAFRDDAQKRIVAVVVNNHPEPATVILKTAGRVDLSGEVRGEQSSAEGYWLPLTAAALREDGSISIVLPARSVTSLSLGFR
jgi:hypothetical protein